MDQQARVPAVISPGTLSVGVFQNAESFALAQRMAQALSASDLVPTQYKGSVSNCLVAIEMAGRVGASVLMVAQNLNVIHGRPSWSAPFILAAIRASGKWKDDDLIYTGTEGTDLRGCQFKATEAATGRVRTGPVITIKMAKAEGWYSRERSKWPNMPDVMLSYRAVSFWSRLFAGDITMGMLTTDEMQEIDVTPGSAANPVEAGATVAGVEDLNKAAADKPRRTRRTQAAPAAEPDAPAAAPAHPAGAPSSSPDAGASAPQVRPGVLRDGVVEIAEIAGPVDIGATLSAPAGQFAVVDVTEHAVVLEKIPGSDKNKPLF